MFHHRERAKQLLDFGTITGMDLDFAYEKAGVWFLGEVKYADAPMTVGQELYIENTCKALERVGSAVGFVARHHVEDAEQDVYLPDLLVERYYYRGQWRDPVGQTVAELIDSAIAKLAFQPHGGAQKEI